MAFSRKVFSGATSGAIAPLSDTEQNSFSGQLSQEKFTRWASGPPGGGGSFEAQIEGVADTVPEGRRAVLPVGPSE